MIIQHNLIANFSNRQLGINSTNKTKSTEKLGSGYRINRAADNAAELSISEKMRGQIRGLNQASQNMQDGLSLLQTADGAYNEVHSILQRMRELSVQSASDTYTDEDRGLINDEYQALKKEVNRISRQTEFNTQKIINDDTVSVGGTPGDIKIFTTNNSYGGIVYQGVRYEWSKFILSGGTDTLAAANPKDGDYSLETVHGTKLYFTKEKGTNIPDISKKYDIQADSSKIQIDDYTYSWSDVLGEDGSPINKFNPQEGLYSLSHKGSQIGFYVVSGDTFDDVIDNLKASGAGSKSSWESKIDSTQSIKAVYDLQRITTGIAITNSNKDHVDSPSIIHADTTGIWLNNNTLKKWDELDFNPPFYNGDSQGIDFTTGKGIGSDTKVTFQCPDTDIAFTFTISEEASMEDVIAGLNNVNMPAVINSPALAQVTLDHPGVMTTAAISSTNLSFETQRDGLGLDFDTLTAASASLSYAVSPPGYQISCGGTSFELDATGINAIDAFFRDGSNGNTLTLQFRNGSSDSIRIDFTRSGNDIDPARPGLTDHPAIDNYVAGKISDFQTQFANTALSIQSTGASMSVGNIYENSILSGNAAISFIYGVKPKEEDPLIIQSGANANQDIKLYVGKINTINLGIFQNNISSRAAAQASIASIQKAINLVSSNRSGVGAYQNRLEHAIGNADNISENLQSSESRLRDTDMAEEMVRYSKSNILEQVSQSILAQANQSAQNVLSLLQ